MCTWDAVSELLVPFLALLFWIPNLLWKPGPPRHLATTLLHYQLPHSIPQVGRLLLCITLKTVFLTGAQGHRVGNSRHLQLSVTASDVRGSSLRPVMSRIARHKPTLRVGAAVPPTANERSGSEFRQFRSGKPSSLKTAIPRVQLRPTWPPHHPPWRGHAHPG